MDQNFATKALVLRVNGGGRSLVVEARVSLLDALREHLDLPGTKKGSTRALAAPALSCSMGKGCCRASPWRRSAKAAR